MKAMTYTVESEKGFYIVTVKPVGLGYFIVSARKSGVPVQTRSEPALAIMTANVQATINEIVPE